MGRRTLLLVAALVVAALGTTGIFLYVNGVDRRAQAGYKLVQVFVATEDIPAGTTGGAAVQAGAIEKRPFFQESLKGLNPVPELSTISKQVALARIAAGEPIVAGQFGVPGESSRLPIPSGKLAVSVALDDPNRVAGFVEPGSSVAIFLTAPEASGPNGGQTTTRLLLSSVQVIAIGNRTATADAGSSGGEAVPNKLLTLAVDQADAQKIVYAQQLGPLTLALMNNNSNVTNTEPATTTKNLFP